MQEPHTFAGNPLYRAGNERRDPAWVAEQLSRPETRFLPYWRLNVLLRGDDAARLHWMSSEVCQHVPDGIDAVLLGLRDDVAHFAVDVSVHDDPAATLSLDDGLRFSDVRSAASQLPGEEAAIVAQGRAMVDWHARHQFCPACGAPTTMRDGGIVRVCTRCETEQFPRTDPVVIMLVQDGDRCLLGRQEKWPKGRFSALAGFVDQAETIEEAVRREVHEEAGLELSDVSYHSSQPWPFPSSLMIGCFAQAATNEIRIDEHELAEAHWFSRERVIEALENPDADPDFALPPPIAIAHQLIRAWATQ